MNSKKHKKEVENNEAPSKLNLLTVLSVMPTVLRRVVLSRFAVSVVTVATVCMMIALTKDWNYSIAILLALFAAYLGFDILWKYAEGKIFVARMVVCKTSKPWRRRFHLTLRPAAIENIKTEEFETYQFTVSPSRREIGNITAGTLMDIYFTEDAPNNILAYMILGEVSS